MKLAKKRTMTAELLPEEMVTEILAKMPTKSLMRFSCVCKAWRDLIIRNPYFREKCSDNYKTSNGDIMVFARCQRRSLDFKRRKQVYISITQNAYTLRSLNIPSFGTLKQNVRGSCNGIICLASRNQTVHLYNPITREDVTLPPGLGGDEICKNKERYGFGFDRSTNDYKVVRISLGVEKIEYVEIYALSTNCWRKLELQHWEIARLFRFHRKSGVFLNGFFHWVVGLFRIATFDFEAEIFGQIECVELGPDTICQCLTVLNDSLAGICTDYLNRMVGVCVMMKYRDKDSWTKKFSCRFPDDIPSEPSLWLTTSWVGGINQLVLLTKRGQLFTCHGEEKPGTKATSTEGVVFQPSLVSLRFRCGKHLMVVHKGSVFPEYA